MRNLGLGDLGFLAAASGVAYDADALAYMTAVEAADGQALETAVKDAIDAFVRGCKTDGIWNAIKASCILAGARTLAGALVPLVGAAPTNFNFVAGDYNRKTGLIGDGSTKYLNSNRNNNADPQNSNHRAVFVSSASTSGSVNTSNSFPCHVGTGANTAGAGTFGRFDSNSTNGYARNNCSAAATISGMGSTTSFVASGRSASASYSVRHGGSTVSVTQASETPFNGSIGVYREGAGAATSTTYSNARLAFYSIGESLDLALLDARVTALINALAAAIP